MLSALTMPIKCRMPPLRLPGVGRSATPELAMSHVTKEQK